MNAPREVSLPGRYVLRDVATLVPYDRNARIHSEQQIDLIADSIREFGFTNPLLLDGDAILAGHGRLRAALKVGLAQVPCIELAGLSEAQKRAYIIADNNLALKAGWDIQLLAAEVAALEAGDIDLHLLGFNDAELAQLAAPMAGTVDHDAAWVGMPDYASRDKQGFKVITVHFQDQAAVDAFALLIQRPLTEQTRFLWFPPKPINVVADKRYAAEDPTDVRETAQ